MNNVTFPFKQYCQEELEFAKICISRSLERFVSFFFVICFGYCFAGSSDATNLVLGFVQSLQVILSSEVSKHSLSLHFDTSKVFVDSKGKVSVNGVLTYEPYVSNFCQDQCRTINRLVPQDHVLVLGDNRSNSWDGRFWPGGGFLPEEEIIGKATWRFWPRRRIGKLN